MKILIVDDEKEIRESLYNIIKIKVNKDYEIKEAPDGLEALSLVDSFGPDIVLTDMMMPNMGGMRFTKLLKSKPFTKNIFVVAITGLSGEEEIQKIYESGVDFYIAKPFQIDDIVARLKVVVSLIGYKKDIYNAKPPVTYNCFNDEEIKNYFLTFSITKEEDIFLLFDYFSNQLVKYDSLLLKDFMVILIKAYKSMEGIDKAFNLIIEESKSYLYVTVHNDLFIETIQHLVSKNPILFQYAQNNNAFSFRINIVALEQTKSNQNEIFSTKTKLVSAEELNRLISSDILKYAQEINYKIHEYKALSKKIYTYNKIISIKLVNLLEQYSVLFQRVNQFESVCIALKDLLDETQSIDIKNIDKLNHAELMKYFNALNSNIEDWVIAVLSNKTSANIHYNDENIITNCKLINKEFNNAKR